MRKWKIAEKRKQYLLWYQLQTFFLLFILSISLQQNVSFFIFQCFFQDQCYIFYIPSQLFCWLMLVRNFTKDKVFILSFYTVTLLRGNRNMDADINVTAQERDTINILSKWLRYYATTWDIYLLHLCLQENNECWKNRGNYKILGKIKCENAWKTCKYTDLSMTIEIQIYEH